MKCTITDNRKYLNQAQAFLFYGSSIEGWNLPLPRTENHIWALFHEESPKNVALLLYDASLSLFNMSSTFSRYSDIPLTLMDLPGQDALTGLEYYISTAEKDSLRGSDNDSLAPVLYLQSDCETPLERDAYVTELMKYIKIDSYGRCLNNRQLPQSLVENHLKDLYAPELMKLVARYKFTLAFENAVCEDYITEKLWRPLLAGSVPVYLGSPSVQDWLPDSEHSAILVKNFDSPAQLAEHLTKLDLDSRQYERHLQHKLSESYPITNGKLKRAMEDGWATETSSLVQKFECRVCEAAHLHAKDSQSRTLSTEHKARSGLERREYDCPKPRSPLTHQPNSSNWWRQYWRESGCHYQVVLEVLNQKVNFTEELYKERIMQYVKEKRC